MIRPINRCLNAKLVEICNHAMKLETVNQIIKSYLPSSMKDYCSVGSFNNGCLKLILTEQIFASELRYSLPNLRDTLRREAGLFQLASIKLEIAVLDNTQEKKRKQKLSISENARQAIVNQADMIEHQDLKEAFYKLADKD
ncbi:DciA family protein [Legionella yabuuchiae]|uniref:DciA family protein n=1 Tax=Legionella yabuuchiae TaxID=376727 RepID=UPI001055E001|nr:DciA family protein [Legionella yabuuchiae]